MEESLHYLPQKALKGKVEELYSTHTQNLPNYEEIGPTNKNSMNLVKQSLVKFRLDLLESLTSAYTEVTSYLNFRLPFVQVPEDEIHSPERRHKIDLDTFQQEQQELASKYPPEIIQLTKILVNLGLVPSYSIDTSRIQEIYQMRTELMDLYFDEAYGEGLRQLITTKIDTKSTKHAEKSTLEITAEVYKNLHKDKDIKAYLRICRDKYSIYSKPLARKKSLISTVSKILRKDPEQITIALNAIDIHTRLFLELEALKRNNAPNEDIAKKQEQLDHSHLKLHRIREKFKTLVHDLFGMTFVTQAVEQKTSTLPALSYQPSELSENFVQNYLQQQVENHRSLIAQAFSQFANDDIRDEYLTLLYQYDNPFQGESISENKETMSEHSKKINHLILKLLNTLLLKKPEAIRRILEENHLLPMHQRFFSLLFFVHEAGWRIKDVSDYLSAYKRGEKGITYTGIQIQITDEFGKSFEIQVKDTIMQWNSTHGTARHDEFKAKAIEAAKQKCDWAKMLWLQTSTLQIARKA